MLTTAQVVETSVIVSYSPSEYQETMRFEYYILI